MIREMRIHVKYAPKEPLAMDLSRCEESPLKRAGGSALQWAHLRLAIMQQWHIQSSGDACIKRHALVKMVTKHIVDRSETILRALALIHTRG